MTPTKPCADLDAEGVLLCTAIMDPQRILPWVGRIKPHHFYSHANGSIWAVCCERSVEGADGSDIVDTSRRLKARSAPVDSTYLIQLMDVPSASDLTPHAQSVVSNWARRQIRDTLALAATQAESEDLPSLLQTVIADTQYAIDATKGSRTEWEPCGDVYDKEEPIPWLVPDLYLGPGRPSSIQGYGYSGKTTIAMSLLLSIASGKPAFGHYPVKQGVVGHLDYEMGQRALKRKYRRLARAMGINADVLNTNLRRCVLPKIKMSDPEFERWITDAVRRDKLTCCLIDSLRAAVINVDEADSRMRTFLDILLRVSEATQCTFLVIHHEGKEPTDAKSKRDKRQAGRGSSAIFDACGTVLAFALVPTPDDAPTGSVYTKCTMTKASGMADGGAVQPFVVSIADIANDDASDMRWAVKCTALGKESAEPAGDDTKRMRALQDRILRWLRKHPQGSGANTIVGALPGRRASILAALDLLVESGEVTRTAGNNRSTVYSINRDDESTDET